MADLDRTQPDGGSVWPSWVNLIIGIWLIVSAFVLPHTLGAETNTWIVGILIATAALWSMFAPGLRFADTILAIWLFFSTLGFPHDASVWNNVIVSIVVFLVSLVPIIPTTTPRLRRATAHGVP